MQKEDKCRCGHETGGEHPCHGNQYRCRKPAIQRFVNQRTPYALAGTQMKFSAYDTWACDNCWEEFRKLISEIEPQSGEL